MSKKHYNSNKNRKYKINGGKPITEGTILKQLTNLSGHTHGIMYVGFHETRPLLVTGSYDNTAKLWDVSEDGSAINNISTFKGHTQAIYSVAIQNIGNLVATASGDKTIKIWNYLTELPLPPCLNTLVGHTDSVVSVSFISNGNLLASGSQDRTIRIWFIDNNGSKAKCADIIKEHTGEVISVLFHPNGSFLASCSADKTIKFWSFNSNGTHAKCINTLNGHIDEIISISFNKNGNILASTSMDKIIKLWTVSSDGLIVDCVNTWQGHTSVVQSLAFYPLGNYFASGGIFDNSIKLWHFSADGSKLELIDTFQNEPDERIQYSLSFHPGGKILASNSYSYAPNVILYDCQKLSIKSRRKEELTHGNLATPLIEELTTSPAFQSQRDISKMTSIIQNRIRNVQKLNKLKTDKILAEKFQDLGPRSDERDKPLQLVEQSQNISSVALDEEIEWRSLKGLTGNCDEIHIKLQKLIKLRDLSTKEEKDTGLINLWIKKLQKKISECR